MKLGFKVGFITTLGILAAYYVYQILSFAVTTFLVKPLIGYLIGQ